MDPLGKLIRLVFVSMFALYFGVMAVVIIAAISSQHQ